MSNSIIRAIKQEIADALLADPYFATIPVLATVKNDVLNEIQAGQDHAHPVTVLVDWLSLHNTNPDTPGPWFSQGIFLVEIMENPALNLTGPDVDEVAENAANVLHLAMLESQNTAVVETITKADNDDLRRNVRQVRLTFPLGFQPRVLPALEEVTIYPLTQGSQSVTLACLTPGAALFFTLDGSYPSPRNPSASLYVSPVGVSSGQLLQARAWRAGYAAPQPATSQFQY